MFAPTRSLCHSGMPGFWRRSVDEFRRQAGLAVRMDGLRVPQKPFPLIQFDAPDAIERCKLLCDSDAGGFSRASLTYRAGAARDPDEIDPGAAAASTGLVNNAPGREDDEPAHVVFHGRISTELPPRRPDIQRSGYAAWRTRDRGRSLFGRLLWDVDPYGYLALRVKSDGRKYMVNVQTESIVPTDLHQHLLPCYAPGEWETVTIPWNAFVRTNHGMAVEPQKEMLRQKVRSVGIGLTDRVPGPFEICIADVYATNTAASRGAIAQDSGFDLASETDGGMFGEVEERRKKGEPERILI